MGIRDKKTEKTINVPCGRCPDCCKRRTSGWSFRLMQEDKRSMNSHFITLTYDTAHVPISKNGFMELRKRDLQLFFKRLRKAQSYILPNWNIRYYAVGEYGGRTRRPHYHIILFNVDIKLINEAWNLGDIHYGQLSAASVGYTLKYISKEKKGALHRNDDRTPMFSLMSKGLGSNYLTDAMIKWHKSNLENHVHCTTNDGKKLSMPRYYKDKIYTESERAAIAYFGKKKALELLEEAERQGGETYYRDKAENDMNAFSRMYINSSQNEKI